MGSRVSVVLLTDVRFVRKLPPLLAEVLYSSQSRDQFLPKRVACMCFPCLAWRSYLREPYPCSLDFCLSTPSPNSASRLDVPDANDHDYCIVARHTFAD